jgi:DNA-binding beta-propeller fold protein YncE
MTTMEWLGATEIPGVFDMAARFETAFDPTTESFFVADFHSGMLWQFDGATFEVAGSVDVGTSVTSLVVDPIMHKLYVAGDNYHGVVGVEVNIFDTVTLNPIASLTLDGNYGLMALHQRSHRIFMTVGGYNAPEIDRMYVIDGYSDNLLTTIWGRTGRQPVVNQKTDRVYAGTNHSVVVISASYPRIVASVELQGYLYDFIINPESGLVYASQADWAQPQPYSVAVIADPVFEPQLEVDSEPRTGSWPD